MRTLSMHIVTYWIEYLGEFEFIYETILDYVSGDQMGSFNVKIRHRKSHAWAPLTSQLRTVRIYYTFHTPNSLRKCNIFTAAFRLNKMISPYLATFSLKYCRRLLFLFLSMDRRSKGFHTRFFWPSLSFWIHGGPTKSLC
jgi:hypothetical protein